MNKVVFRVRGTSSCADVLPHVCVGQDVCLEPSGTEDLPDAVEVWVRIKGQMVRVGYVPANLCAHVRELLDNRCGAGIWNTRVVSVDSGLHVAYEYNDAYGNSSEYRGYR